MISVKWSYCSEELVIVPNKTKRDGVLPQSELEPEPDPGVPVLNGVPVLIEMEEEYIPGYCRS